MDSVALVVVYNHHYPQNVARLNVMYRDRFSSVTHLIPSYAGDRSDVIPVFGNGQRFNSFVAQAYHHLKAIDADRFLFIGDDLVLNPQINQANTAEVFGLDTDSCFLPFFLPFWDLDRYYALAHDAYYWRPSLPGAEVESLLPSVAEAQRRFAEAGYPVRPVPYSVIHLPGIVTSKTPVQTRKLDSGAKHKGLLDRVYESERGRALLRTAYSKAALPLERLRKPVSLPYPIIGGYADIFCVPKHHLKTFSNYCGVFAAGGLYCEAAIPTATVLTTSDIITEADLPRRGRAYGTIPIIGAQHWHAGPRPDFAAEYDRDIARFLADFPQDTLYIHPVKMSAWRSADGEGLDT